MGKSADGLSTPQVPFSRWQKITLATLFVGYAGYYLCRSNLSIATPLLEGDGFKDAQIGDIASVGTVFYAIGKVTNGVTTDYLGGRFLFLLGMLIAVICTVSFGLSGGLLAMTILWAINRYVGSMGWGALVKTVSRWFPVSRHATVMGILSMSYLLGDALVRAYLSFFLFFNQPAAPGAPARIIFGWQELFFISAGTLAVIALVSYFTLKSSPADVGEPEPPANPHNVFGTQGQTAEAGNIVSLLLPLLTSPLFWLICTISFGLTLIRETFNQWIPAYLFQTTGLDAKQAAISSVLFPLVGAASVLFVGMMADRFGHSHGKIIVPSLVLLAVTLFVLSALPSEKIIAKESGGKSTATAESSGSNAAIAIPTAPAANVPVHAVGPGRRVAVLGLIGLASFFLLGPYSLLAGVMALDLGGKRGSSTTAGLVDSAGYFGAILSGSGVGRLATNFGWASAFSFLAAVSLLTLIAAVIYWRYHDALVKRRAENEASPAR